MKISNPVTCEHLLRNKISFANEELWCVALSKSCELISLKKIASGTEASVLIHSRKLLEFTFEVNAQQIILAHSHTEGDSLPSAKDIFWTEKLYAFFNTVDIKLCDHIILSQNGSTSLLSYDPNIFE